jgi:glycerol-3-phosphate dehydrogenase
LPESAAIRMSETDSFDLAVVGGGINGCGIACDAAGRGLKVVLAEMGDLASATSSASSKLIHGGLRYLEHYEFKLVRHALAEREVLMRKAPQIIWPLRFVLPHVAGLRPQWMIRSGLFLYDHLYRRDLIPGSRSLDLRRDPASAVLKDELTSGFSYYDCWVDDARLVILNAIAARDHGAEIMTRSKVTAAVPDGDHWRVTILSGNVERTIRARALVNAAGPWAGRVDGLSTAVAGQPRGKVRLVKGSHIVLPRLPGIGDDAFLMQHADKRVVFVLPFEERFTIIGTTDIPYDHDPANVAITPDEERYLIDLAQKFFKVPLRQSDIIWRYSGVRPLFDDNADDPSAVTRDYRLELNNEGASPPRLSVYGGKVTTYRVLAEDALALLRPHLPHMRQPWTATAPLPGGNLPAKDFDSFVTDLATRYPAFERVHLQRLARRYGDRIGGVLGDTKSLSDLGRHFGEGLTEREIAHMKADEWARTADDVLWRRSKLGLHLKTRATEQDYAQTVEAIARLL